MCSLKKDEFNSKIQHAEKEIIERSKKISFYTTEYTVELLAQKMKSGEYDIPSYQREFNWDLVRKSKFIESLIMGLPIPFLFLWQKEDGKLEVVDGSQRLRTIEEYVLGGLKLSELEGLPSLTGTKFTDLLPSRQLKIKNLPIRGIVLNEHADEQARFDMFERINTGSLIANTAEIRRGALRGPFQSLIEHLARSELLLNLAPMSKKAVKERAPEELVARFFAYGDGLDDYRDSPSKFIFEYIKSKNEDFEKNPALSAQYSTNFTSMLHFVRDKLPYGFRKAANYNSTPRVRFEAIAIGVALALQENRNLKDANINTRWLDSAEFKHFTTTDAANVKSKILNRIEFVKQKLLENV